VDAEGDDFSWGERAAGMTTRTRIKFGPVTRCKQMGDWGLCSRAINWGLRVCPLSQVHGFLGTGVLVMAVGLKVCP
jgi:hypothetical protein